MGYFLSLLSMTRTLTTGRPLNASMPDVQHTEGQGGRTSGDCRITTGAGHARLDRYKHSLTPVSGRTDDAGQGAVGLGGRAGGRPRSQAAVQEPAPPPGGCPGRGLLRGTVRLRGLRRAGDLWPQEGRLLPALPGTPRGDPVARHL